ncbi:uncharacterized protein BDZ83DRAFT_286913 [Colletotrichum acutatum]|uniref:Uncharacterized protein n=1 Tax=Glomerella acutata TaxID=27357 RepID=A0AAD8XFQ6_GLOAC|nr:uncharacterized protein BDZ83DRAFT_286913 [Colletotrichum acutatum]KAK1725667.1 hypothetical protein BDZ83DRAFT_286913 [Colletotrichum acutatum]
MIHPTLCRRIAEPNLTADSDNPMAPIARWNAWPLANSHCRIQPSTAPGLPPYMLHSPHRNPRPPVPRVKQCRRRRHLHSPTRRGTSCVLAPNSHPPKPLSLSASPAALRGPENKSTFLSPIFPLFLPGRAYGSGEASPMIPFLSKNGQYTIYTHSPEFRLEDYFQPVPVICQAPVSHTDFLLPTFPLFGLPHASALLLPRVVYTEKPSSQLPTRV